MKRMQNVSEREIDGLFNVRIMGGNTPWLVRTGATEGLTRGGAVDLRELGVARIIDLREVTEHGPRPAHGIEVVSAPLYGTEPPATGRLEPIYEMLLRERGAQLAAAVTVIAETNGAALVHCTAGKDRTGLVVALARLAAGDAASAVVEDYTRSGPHVRPVRAAAAEAFADAGDPSQREETLRLHLDSPREAIEHALAVIDDLGGAVAYLRANGLTEAHITALQAKNALVGTSV